MTEAPKHIALTEREIQILLHVLREGLATLDRDSAAAQQEARWLLTTLELTPVVTTDATESDEIAYECGSRRAYIDMLAFALGGLGYDLHTLNAASLAKERAEAIATLRRVCVDHGDNDWEDNLHLSDVIEKHLARYLTPPLDAEMA